MGDSKIDQAEWEAERAAFNADADRRQALAKTRRKHLFASIEDDPAHGIASAQDDQEARY